MDGVTRILGMAWIDDEPHLRVRVDGGPSTLVPVRGLRLTYTAEVATTRRCIGHKPFRGGAPWHDCDNAPLPDSRTCDRCTASDATFASQLHHAHTKSPGELDPAVLKHLRQSNELYLAGFRDGSVKVGTSTAPRLRTRLAEQGAWRALVVASSTDGFGVRSIEDRVTIALGLPQSISMRRKLAGIDRPRPDAELVRELELWSGRVHELLEDASDDRLTPLRVEWAHPVAADPVWADVHPYPLKPDSGSHDLELVTALGRAVVAKRPDLADHFVFDIQRLYGLELRDVGDAPDELAVQDSLF